MQRPGPSRLDPLDGVLKYGVPQSCGMLIRPPTPARGPSPTLTTLHRIERVLRSAAAHGESPLSYAEIGRRLPARKVRRETIKAAVAELRRFHLVAEGKKGVLWVLAEDDAVWDRPSEPLA